MNGAYYQKPPGTATAMAAEGRRRLSELPTFLHHKSSLPHTQQHQDAAIAAAAAEGARMAGVQMTPPKMESTRRRTTGEFQVFLCLLGALLSASVSFWMGIFSKDALVRRALISSVAAMCALIFAVLAFVAFKKRKRKEPVDDIEISQSILREQRKSMTSSLRKSTGNGGDEFIQQIRRHSSVIAVDSARQKLLLQQAAKAARTPTPTLLSVDSPGKPQRAISTSD